MQFFLSAVKYSRSSSCVAFPFKKASKNAFVRILAFVQANWVRTCIGPLRLFATFGQFRYRARSSR